MRIGVPREIKDGEFRVALTPAAVAQLKEVVVEPGAGETTDPWEQMEGDDETEPEDGAAALAERGGLFKRRRR